MKFELGEEIVYRGVPGFVLDRTETYNDYDIRLNTGEIIQVMESELEFESNKERSLYLKSQFEKVIKHASKTYGISEEEVINEFKILNKERLKYEQAK
jgi:hypothetical protein